MAGGSIIPENSTRLASDHDDPHEPSPEETLEILEINEPQHGEGFDLSAPSIRHPVFGHLLFPVDNGGKRKRAAGVWAEFKFYKDITGNFYDVCVHCKKCIYKANSRFGTSSPKRHLDVCLEYKSVNPSLNMTRTTVFSQKKYVELMADAIMMHGYPFTIVEHVGLRKVHLYLNEKVKTISRNTVKKVCIERHVQYKGQLKQNLSTLSSRVCLTSDIWTACTDRSYLTLTAHYVDDKWKLCSKVLSFIHFPPPHSGLDIYDAVKKLIEEWGLGKKVLTITLDNASNMTSMVTDLKKTLAEYLPCGGKYFHVRCSAHILNLVVKEGLERIEDCVGKVRENVKYIDASEGRLNKFHDCAKYVSLSCDQKLWLDVSTRWNSTYLMLKRAMFFKEALIRFGEIESGYKFCLSQDEWLRVKKICEFLAPFYEITNLFYGSDYPTANSYFYNVWKIEKLLRTGLDCADEGIKSIAKGMYEKFDKYWGDFSMVLTFAVLLDPCYKFGFVTLLFKKLHGDEAGIDESNKVRSNFIELFQYYEKKVTGGVQSVQATNMVEENSTNNELEEFLATHGGRRSAGMTEYETYFSRPVEDHTPGFDVLDYWKNNSTTYPVLSSMAKDILAIPITTVASESTFSMGGRVLNKWRSSLLSKHVDALVTTRNWLFGYEDLEACGVDVQASDSSDNDNNDAS